MPFIGVQPASALLSSADIQDGQITTAKIADTAVTTAKVTDDAIGNTKLDLTANYAFTGTVSGTVSGSDAFHARGNTDAWGAISAGTILQFPDDSSGDSFDTGSRYSTSTYKYTARATGVYIFYYSIYTAHTDSENAFSFLKNSTKLSNTYNGLNYISHSEGTDDRIQNGTIIIDLATDDTMAVIASISSDYYKGHSSWGGCRLA